MHMSKIMLVWFALLGSVLLVVCSCSGDGEETVEPLVPDDFRISDQLGDWLEREDSYTPFDASGMFSLVNGAAQVHVDAGLVDGFYQQLENSAGRLIDIYVERFDSAEGALSIYQTLTDGLGELLTIDAFPANTAGASRVLGGAVIYAYGENFAFSLTMTGYAGSDQEVETMVLADGNEIMNFYSEVLFKEGS